MSKLLNPEVENAASDEPFLAKSVLNEEDLIVNLPEESLNPEESLTEALIANAAIFAPAMNSNSQNNAFISIRDLKQKASPNKQKPLLTSEGHHDALVVTKETKMRIKNDELSSLYPKEHSSIFSGNVPVVKLMPTFMPILTSISDKNPYFSITPSVSFPTPGNEPQGVETHVPAEADPLPSNSNPVIDIFPQMPALIPEVASPAPVIEVSAPQIPAPIIPDVQAPEIHQEPISEQTGATPVISPIDLAEPAFSLPGEETLLPPSGLINSFTSYFAQTMSIPSYLADAVINSASSAYNNYFDKQPIDLAEIQSLEAQIATEKTQLSAKQIKIADLNDHLTMTKAQLDKNIQQAIQSYEYLENKNVGMDQLIESYAPGGVVEKFKEGFTAAWAKVNPAEVTATLMGLTPYSSGNNIDWILDHVAQYEVKLTEAANNAIKTANQTAAKLTNQEVTTFEQAQSILQAEKAHLAELMQAKEEANFSFHLQNTIYQGQAFYDFSKTGEYKNTKFALDEASANYETASLKVMGLEKEILSVEKINNLLSNAHNTSELCLEIQKNLSDWQTDSASQKVLKKEEKALLADISYHESSLESMQKQYALENHLGEQESGSSVFEDAFYAFKTIAEAPSVMAQNTQASFNFMPVSTAYPDESRANVAKTPSLENESSSKATSSWVESFSSYGKNLFGSSSQMADNFANLFTKESQPVNSIPDKANILTQEAPSSSKITLEDVLTKPDFFTQKIQAPRLFDSAEHVNYFNTLNDVTQNAKHALSKLEWREAQLNQAKVNLSEAEKMLELSKAEAGHLDNPKYTDQKIAHFPGMSFVSTFFSHTGWQNEKIDSLDTALKNKAKTQDVFDHELKAISHKASLDLAPQAINLKTVNECLIEKLSHIQTSEKVDLLGYKARVEKMSSDIGKWDKVISDFKAYDTAYNQYVDSQKFYAQAHAQYENNEAILHRVQLEKPGSLDAFSHAGDFPFHSAPTLEKLGGHHDCCKEIPLTLEGF